MTRDQRRASATHHLTANLHRLLDGRPGILVIACFLLMLLVVQVPLRYTFQVGQERGPRSDLPFLQNFNTAENSYTDRSFRWTRGESRIEVPGVGQRNLLVTMQILSHRAQWQPDIPPPVVEMQFGDRPAVPITLRQPAAHYHFYVPESAIDNGVLRMGLTTAPWQGENDRRAELGVAVGRLFTVTAAHNNGFVLPDPGLILAWPLSLLLFWVALRIMHFTPRAAFWLLLPLVFILPLLTLFEAPRLAFGNLWVLQAGVISLACAALAAWQLPPLLRRLEVPAPPALLSWLLLLIVLSFALKYAGRLYPESMPGDLQLHVNRYTLTVHGRFFIQAQHRGLPFPFPNGLYVMIAPLTLTGLGIHFLFELTAGLFEATMPILLYLFMTRAARSPQIGLLAAAIYALTPAGFMTTWFAFETQVAALWFSTLLMAVLVICWPNYRNWKIWWFLVFLFAQAFLGHIGQFINTVLLGLLVIPLLWWRYPWPEERRGTRQILTAAVTAGLFAGLFYYSRFTGLFLDQLYGMTSGGLNDITGRAPIPREATLRSLWYDGVLTHFGFFPILLAFLGAVLLLNHPRLRRSLLPPLVWLTFFVALSQAFLPLITLSSITTRWLLFATWGICVTAALTCSLLWRYGRSARLVALAMTGYVCWMTILVWIDAMALRDPPVEPF